MAISLSQRSLASRAQVFESVNYFFSPVAVKRRFLMINFARLGALASRGGKMCKRI
jgi:hypothetical protein